eukprot:SAG22_NODE_374_length_11548_cov_6.893615_6_plen_239_part_00
MALQNRAAMWGRTVISNCYADGGIIQSAAADAEREALRPAAARDPLKTEKSCDDARDPEVAEWLRKSGVRRVVVGHKPSGDCPAVCAAAYTGLEVVSADTSFSRGRADPPAVPAPLLGPDTRGLAVTAVTIRGESLLSNATELTGVLADGRRHHGRLCTLGGAADMSGGDRLLGTEEEGGWWYKARLAESALSSDGGGAASGGGALYRQTRGAGRTVEHRDVGVEGGAGGQPIQRARQ